MEQLIQVIAATQNPSLRQQAEAQLTSFQNTDFSQYIVSLIQILSTATLPTNIRQSAGILFKNLFPIKGSHKAQSLKIWNEISNDTKMIIRKTVCSLLSEQDNNIILIGGNIISNLANLDLPQGQWPELMPFLLTDGSVAKLKTIGFITEDIPFIPFAPFIEQVENLCISSLTKSFDHCISALTIFENMISFEKIMSNPTERKKILEVLLTAVKHNHPAIKTKGFQAISTFTELYIEYFSEIGKTIMEVTSDILKQPMSIEIEDLQKTVLHLWRTVASNERRYNDHYPNNPPLKIVISVIDELKNLIIHIISFVDDPNDDIDENDLSFIAQDTLYDLSVSVGSGLLVSLSPQILSLYTNPDWKIRFQALSTFACLVVPNDDPITLLRQHVNQIVNLFNDPVPLNRATVIYCIIKCIKHYPKMFDDFLKIHASNVFSMFKDCPIVKKAVSSFFSTICDPQTGVNCKLFLNGEAVTSIIRTFLDESMRNTSISECTSYLTASGNVVRGCCSGEMAITIIRFILSDCMSTQLFNSSDLLGYSILFLDSCVSATKNGTSGNEVISTLLSNKPICDSLFGIAIKAFSMTPEPSLMLIGSLCYSLEASFAPYCLPLIPKTVEWLNTELPPNIYKLLCELVGDISITIQKEFEQYARNYLELILRIFKKPYLTFGDKTGIIQVIGDIIATCPKESQIAVPTVVEILSGVNTVQSEEEDEIIRAVSELRTAAFYVYSTIYQNYVIDDVIPFVKITIQLIYISVSDKFFSKMPQLINYIPIQYMILYIIKVQ
ncbi:hypothetical protein CL6EHI_171760 [Entamoeba histolytica]|uniref:Importin N-terminal domain-containing protein n=1 Tax=Entamoeba histolytica TaxID=5759 RepID=A0A175JYD4_ENTHI|nr:hypothetical protein CL6EHI_171760 [Entamoeba histolytica]